MSFPSFTTSNKTKLWERFCELLWFDDHLGIWLDISRMKVNEEELIKLESIFQTSFEAMRELEAGSIANQDENRQVGHYWLRNPSLAPSKLISDKINNQINTIANFADDILLGNIRNTENNPFTDVLWIGIGGSGLGPLLIVESLQKLGKGLHFHFVDNVDTEGILRQLESIESNLRTTLIVVVSKSGGTPEPQIGMEQARHFLEKRGCIWNSQAIAITMEGSDLDEKARKEDWLNRFDLPDWVGGRTSITGAVGLLPIHLIGANAKSFLAGASQMDEITRNTNFRENPAALLAAAWLIAGDAKGSRDMVVLPYKDRLEVFSRYLQQLVMESLGKRQDRLGNVVNQGIAVYGNKGSTDQHAYVQQLRDGLDNFFVTFIEVINDSPQIQSINGRNPGDYLSGFLQGTRSALTGGDRQNLSITIKDFNESSLGALIALFERAVGLYGEIININAYHQPGVEAGKIAAADIILLQSKIEKLLSDSIPRDIDQINIDISDSTKESIFIILRHLTSNNSSYSLTGEWGDPNSLVFKYTG